jgi:hypothetical protein
MPNKDISSLIQDLKHAKAEKEITYPRLIDMLEANGTPISLTTLRRVFADGSEKNDSFNYFTTLQPLEKILLSSDEIMEPENNPYAKEIDGYKAVIHTQNEELVRLYQLIDHLEKRVEFLVKQIEHKDELVDKLMDKVL